MVQFNNKPALLLAGLLHEYLNVNPMVKPILMGFRYWARVSQSHEFNKVLKSCKFCDGKLDIFFDKFRADVWA